METFVSGRKNIPNRIIVEIPIDDERTRGWLKMVAETINDTPDDGFGSVRDYCIELYKKLDKESAIHFIFG